MSIMVSGAGIPAAKANPDIVELAIALVSGLALALTSIFICAAPLTNHISGARDFVVYWATGQQLVHHGNPFDEVAMTRIEHGAGLPDAYTVGFMRNPPWSLPLAMPLGFLPLRLATLLWSLVLLGCLLYSVHLLWIMHGRPANQLHWLGLSFGPALLCLMMGQTSLFPLLGFVLFLRLHGTRPFLAGVSLWLCMLKPHLFLPFGVVLLVWIVVTRSYKVLTGTVVALAASCALVYCVDPMAFSQYMHMIRTVGVDAEFIPCLSIVLRFWISEKTIWIQYVAPAIACAWAIVYYWRHRRSWDWLKEGGMLMVVSIFAAPYCFLYDQGLVIPGLLQGVYLTRSRMLLVILALSSIVVEAELISAVKIHSAQFLWTGAAWLAWYLLAIRFRKTTVAEPDECAPIAIQALP
jgi:Glycosyltransferase family 87